MCKSARLALARDRAQVAEALENLERTLARVERVEMEAGHQAGGLQLLAQGDHVLQAELDELVLFSSPESLVITSAIAGGIRVLQKPVMRLNPPCALSGMMPGTIGTAMPFARHPSTNVTKTSKS